MTDWLSQAQQLFDYTQALRRDFHRHPELGFEEVRTASVVARELTSLGLEVTSGVAKTGVIALLEGGRPGPVVLMRFDMDALPIQEETGAEYASQNPGVMHACGHDGHTAIGLTVAKMLAARRAELPGTLKFVFQPAEEGLGGAQSLVAAGALENPRPHISLALHLWNDQPLGWLAASVGPTMAASEVFKIRLTGKGGHGAMPHHAIDPVLAAAHLVTALQSIVSRNIPPLQAAVLSVTQIHAGETFNVIPPQVELSGTLRSFEPEVRQRLLTRLRQIVHSVAAAMECQAEIELIALTPPVINDPQVAAKVQHAAQRILPDSTLETNFCTMGSEDMAYLMQDVPGCFFFVGSANPQKGLTAAHHHPRFDFDEAALPRAAAWMAAAALECLGAAV